MSSLSNEQREICLKFGASFLRSGDQLKIGISRTFDPTQSPINGLRLLRRATPRGVISGQERSSSTDDGFFVPLHTFHLNDRCPEIVKYFGLGPGWRFLVAPGQEDVWFDTTLLSV